ncbi:hypothetical protein GCM10011391_23260 [Pullulanibacillus camelliae]|uniref:Uncharacterized protein n=1 Tax=Pullulanibacillus camelliae TaxID=1707096 RepID=A0A8J3DUS2_9BACL|nr:hypothetical protein GCM10011391_23260 [Pullulanibacillus camelliae]
MLIPITRVRQNEKRITLIPNGKTLKIARENGSAAKILRFLRKAKYFNGVLHDSKSRTHAF